MRASYQCHCGNNLHDGACYELNVLSASDAMVWETLLAMTHEQRLEMLRQYKPKKAKGA